MWGNLLIAMTYGSGGLYFFIRPKEECNRAKPDLSCPLTGEAPR